MDETNSTRTPTRRELLSLTSAATLTATAGCMVEVGGYRLGFEDADGDDQDDTPTADPTPTAYPDPSFDQDCLGHDPENVEIEQFDGDRWRVMDGDSALLLFEEFENAKQGRDVIQAYGFDSHCFVGRPNAPMDYWLVDGGPPLTGDATIEDEDCTEFDRSNLAVEPFDGDRWRVVDGGLALLLFDSEANAQRAIDLIQHYRLDRICYVGRPNAPMTYWLSERSE